MCGEDKEWVSVGLGELQKNSSGRLTNQATEPRYIAGKGRLKVCTIMQ
jgi:hypothetical protein